MLERTLSGSERAAIRLQQKLEANVAVYAKIPAAPPSRQVRRRSARKAEKKARGK